MTTSTLTLNFSFKADLKLFLSSLRLHQLRPIFLLVIIVATFNCKKSELKPKLKPNDNFLKPGQQQNVGGPLKEIRITGVSGHSLKIYGAASEYYKKNSPSPAPLEGESIVIPVGKGDFRISSQGNFEITLPYGFSLKTREIMIYEEFINYPWPSDDWLEAFEIAHDNYLIIGVVKNKNWTNPADQLATEKKREFVEGSAEAIPYWKHIDFAQENSHGYIITGSAWNALDLNYSLAFTATSYKQGYGVISLAAMHHDGELELVERFPKSKKEIMEILQSFRIH